MAKTLKGIKNLDIEFTHKGTNYKVPVVDSLFIDDLSVDEIKKMLNELPARMAYWKTFLVSLDREIADAEDAFEFWFQKMYMSVDAEHSKRTEGFKKSKVMLDYSDDYRRMKADIRNLQDTHKKINILVSGYNNQIWTLREIARLTHAEIGSLSDLSLKGSGSLADF